MKSSTVAASFILGITVLASSVTASDKDKIDVRTLKFTPKDPTAVFQIGGKGKLTVMTDLAAVEKLVGKDNAKGLAGMVDFNKDQLVLVSWTTSGPPEGTLKYEVKGMGKDRKVIFYVQGPNAAVRGQRARIGADFFALPKDVPVTFEPKER
jgi:hypothetical protein